MKKLLITTICLLTLTSVFIGQVISQGTTSSGQYVIDQDCYSVKVFGDQIYGGGTQFEQNCSIKCPAECLLSPDSNGNYTVKKAGWCCDSLDTASGSCSGAIDNRYECKTFTNSADPDLAKAVDNINFLGIETDRFLLVGIRRIILGVMAAAGLAIVGFGILGMYKYSTSDGNSDKIQDAVKIFKSVAVGAIITFAGIALVQIAATLSGVTGSLFDFNFLPKSGRVVYTEFDDIGKKCLPEQVSAYNSPISLKCDSKTQVWTK